MDKPILSVLNGNSVSPPPLWLMRQAGRYLPEYREVRKKAGSFLNLCFNPELASEVTLQPIRRFGFDASIIFSDILVIPYSLGTDLDYVEGEGPKLSPVRNQKEIKNLKKGRVREKLENVGKALKIVKKELPKKTALIGFAGAPWTVATYMVEGGSSRKFDITKKLLKEEKETFISLLETIKEETIEYLEMQIESGAEIIQIFDSWAAAVPEENFREIVIEPTTEIVAAIKNKYPKVPVIGFPKGIGKRNKEFLETGVDAISIGVEEDRNWVKEKIQKKIAVQGNLDPELLAESTKEKIGKEIEKIKETFGTGKFIFNLGHGILPHTPIEHVEFLIEKVRG